MLSVYVYRPKTTHVSKELEWEVALTGHTVLSLCSAFSVENGGNAEYWTLLKSQAHTDTSNLESALQGVCECVRICMCVYV